MKRRFGLFAVLACAVGLTACATDLFPSDAIAVPSWAESGPSPQDYLRVYPPLARRAEINGKVRLSCLVRQDRRLDCEPGWEEYPGIGFTEAGIEVSKLFVVKPGHPVAKPGARITLPIDFILTD